MLSATPLSAQEIDWASLVGQTNATENKAPRWIKSGAYLYRVATPDSADTLDHLGEGIRITYNLLDGSVEQIAMVNGLIGDDHTGGWNWDGLWPYWGRVSFRAGNWEKLRSFMEQTQAESNAKISFHLNLTDVNVGLGQYPESREFFRKLVETKSIYRRDFNKKTLRHDIEPPYVPREIEKYMGDKPESVMIFALVNYKNLWDSGVAKEMIDGLYAKLPYAPPVLYLDVLNTAGGNFSTGYPDGPLGGSKQTQIEGIQAIAEYLYSKGTDLGTEGDRPEEAGKYGTYTWLHANKGVSRDDYSVIAGAAKGPRAVYQHVFGNTGSFVVSAIASTPGQIDKVKSHYASLVDGRSSSRKMPGLPTWHISDRGDDNDEFNMWLPAGVAGGGDPFRGDWVDLVNNFYLTGIQELYHIGKGNYRTTTYQPVGIMQIGKHIITSPSGEETVRTTLELLPENAPKWRREAITRSGRSHLDSPIAFKFNAPEAGTYQYKILALSGVKPSVNIYVNKQLRATKTKLIPLNNHPRDVEQEYSLGTLELAQGENEISIDAGPVYCEWNDGTKAVWTTPSLGVGFKVTNGDVTFADDYDRMWPDTWSGQKKIYFYSWDGTTRAWKLPHEWRGLKQVKLFPLTPGGRGKAIALTVEGGSVSPVLLPQVPYVLTE